jgi:N-methylhydantoinase A
MLGGRPIELPMVYVHTVGAGGGSIGWRDPGGALRVGPRSAGAEPGPASYRRGGEEPTVTDANLALGYLNDTGSLAGGVELDREAAEQALATLGRELEIEMIEAAEGIIRIANQEMLKALRVVTVERGIDPREFALLAFGGAGALHAAAIAAELEIERIIVPRASGVLSALGLTSGDRRRDIAKTMMLGPAELTSEAVAERIAELTAQVGSPAAGGRLEITYELRYRGQAFELDVDAGPQPDAGELRESFAREHERRYGYRDEDGEVELVGVRLAAVDPRPAVEPVAERREQPERSRRRIRIAG